MIIPTVLGLLLFVRFISRKHRWLSRWAIAVLVAVGMGLNVRGTVEAGIWMVSLATMQLAKNFTTDYYGNLFMFLSIVFSLSYFVFTKEHKGALKPVTTAGRWFLMIGLGALYASTTNTRLATLIPRIQWLIYTWLGLSPS